MTTVVTDPRSQDEGEVLEALLKHVVNKGELFDLLGVILLRPVRNAELGIRPDDPR